jgi:hypothetical protein
MMKLVRKRDLPHVEGRRLPDGRYVEPVRPILYCASCQTEYSATPGDYWSLSDNYVFRCGSCDKPMQLVRRVVQFVPFAKECD